MRLNVIFREENETIRLTPKPMNELISVGFGETHTVTSGFTGDYADLRNKPTINGVEMSGDLTSSDLGIEANFPADGSVGDIMMKTGAARNAVSWVTPATSSEADNTRPITAAAVYTEIGNINALLATI